MGVERSAMAKMVTSPGRGPGPTKPLACRGCGAALGTTLVALGPSPLSNSYLEPAAAELPETFYPLHAYVCERCLLCQSTRWKRPSTSSATTRTSRRSPMRGSSTRVFTSSASLKSVA